MKAALVLLPWFVPVAACWAKWHEARILRLGKPLSPRGVEDARQMGVEFPEKIRVLAVDRIPVLNGRFVGFLSRLVPAISSRTVGLSLRYGIYVRKPYQDDRRLVAHECVHTAQYERAGCLCWFLGAYFAECINDGYPDCGMEQEAVRKSLELED